MLPLRRPSGRPVLALTAAVLACLTIVVVKDTPDAGARPDTVPSPTATTSVVTVKVGSDRTGTNTVGPLAGTTLKLFATEGAATPVADAWATCVSDADGDCNFVVPNTNVGGANRNARFWVRQTAAPAGYFMSPSLRTGNGDGSGSQANTYQFQTPALQSGNTYRSTTDFMFSNQSTRTASGGVWQQSRNNPLLPQQCGLDVAIVMDLSGSVGSALPNLKQAAGTFIDALVGTPSRVALFSFGTNSPAAGGANLPDLMPVSTAAGADVVKAHYAGWTVGGGTNWDRGMWAVAAAAPQYELTVVITDGNPTYFSSPAQGSGNFTRFREVENGIFSANALQAEGGRSLAIGVGSGVSGDTGLNLRAISGPTLFDGTNGDTADYYQTSDYAAAGKALRDLALGRCQGTLSIVKMIVPAGTTGEDVTGAVPASAGWQFDASTSTPRPSAACRPARPPPTRAPVRSRSASTSRVGPTAHSSTSPRSSTPATTW